MNFDLPLRPGDTKPDPVTLLDLFAGEALAGLIAESMMGGKSTAVDIAGRTTRDGGSDAADLFAEAAYRLADAMLKARTNYQDKETT